MSTSSQGWLLALVQGAEGSTQHTDGRPQQNAGSAAGETESPSPKEQAGACIGGSPDKRARDGHGPVIGLGSAVPCRRRRRVPAGLGDVQHASLEQVVAAAGGEAVQSKSGPSRVGRSSAA